VHARPNAFLYPCFLEVILFLFSGERHRMMVKGMEVMLAGDPKLDEDINPYNLPEVSIAIN